MDKSSKKVLTESIAVRLRAVIDNHGLSQRSLAERVGVSQTFVSAVCRGKSLPSIPLVLGLHREFGVSMEWLLAGDSADGVGRREQHTAQPQPQPQPQPQSQQRPLSAGGHLHDLLDDVLSGPGGSGNALKVEGFLTALAMSQPRSRRSRSA